MVVCLNPVLQKTLVYQSFRKGEVNRTAEYRLDAAGKGVCAARVLTQLGERVVHLTHLGGPSRDWFLDLCAKDHVALRWVDSASPIRFCTTVIDESDHTASELVEEAEPVAAPTRARLVKLYKSLLPDFDAVLLSGTVAAGYGPGLMGELARLAFDSGKHSYLDIKGQDLLDCLPARPISVKPNLEELSSTLRRAKTPPANEEELRSLAARAGKDWYERYGTYLVVTRGGKSCLYWDGKNLDEYPVPSIALVNPIGSGDAFGVGLAAALEHGDSIKDAVARGVELGGLNALRLKPGSLT